MAAPNSFSLSMNNADWRKNLGISADTYNSVSTDEVLKLLSGLNIPINNFNTIVPKILTETVKC